MTHVQAIETNKNSHLKGAEISVPVTIIECPPIKIAAIRLYKKSTNSMYRIILNKELLLTTDKNLIGRLRLPKKDFSSELDKLDPKEYDDVRIMVYTQPGMTGFGKKVPDLMESSIGGSSVEEKIKFVKENVGKDLQFESVFQEGDLVDIKSITKGKGFEGPIARFGIAQRQSKSEKSIRNPGTLGPWSGQGHIMWRVAHAGKTGYAQRTEYNKQILKHIKSPEEINPKGGFLRYGIAKNPVVLIKGSLPCPSKRVVVMVKATRVKKAQSLITIEKVSTHEMQGN